MAALLAAAVLSGCGSASRREQAPVPPPPTGGGYYLDDGPGANPPADINAIPDAVPRPEPLSRGTMRPYVVMGRSYTPMTRLEPYRASGIASWYGRRYHGKPTSSGEPYDMYAMTAAHTTLPIPSYVRVTNASNGRSVVVRVNDRGPFVDDRLIDLSYTAAHKLGIVANGSGPVDVELILPGESAPTIAAAPPPLEPAPPPPVAVREPEPAAAPSPVVVAPPVAVAPPASPAPVPVMATPPAASSAPPASAPATTATAGAGGYYLQIGAFGSKSNAEKLIARLKTQLSWLADTLHLYADDGLFRVRAGPFASRGEATVAADRVRAEIRIKPLVLTR